MLLRLVGLTAIVTEWADKGSLKGVLTNRAFKLDWPQMMKWALQIALGLDYLHTRSPKIIHRGIPLM
jgi:serine/threonine protein kinase